jgi:toxin-antitoxin system PIN domain toxin
VTRVALLDVNVLVALFDPDHVHHEAAHRWFGSRRQEGWATCPITENELVRILSNPAYTPSPETRGAIIDRLAEFCASGGHVFWADEISLRDPGLFAWTAPVPHQKLTDVYLLGLARSRTGRLATFDRGIPVAAVAGADRGTLELIPA